MTRPRAGTRRLIGVVLLLQGLLMIQPPDALAAGQSTKGGSPKRVASKEHPARKGKPVASRPRADARERCVHVVRRGDSVARLSARYRVARQSVVTVNQLGSEGALKVGQRLTVPGCRDGAMRRATAARGPSPAVELEDGLLLARVGPARVPTRLFVAVPEFGREAIDFAWPVEGTIASGFGRRRSGWHAGVDIKADMGTPVFAAAPGTVVFSGWAASYGRLVKIKHSNGFTTLYAHNYENLVEVGDEVAAGALIAVVGRSGRASAEHLHFEIRRDGMAFNPLFLLESRDSMPVLVSTATEPLGGETVDDVRE